MVLYRYEKRYVTDESQEHISTEHCDLELITFDVIKETASGYTFLCYNKRKWTSKSSKSRYAYPTKERAIENFIFRTQRHISIMKSKVKIAEVALANAKELKSKMNVEAL